MQRVFAIGAGVALAATGSSRAAILFEQPPWGTETYTGAWVLEPVAERFTLGASAVIDGLGFWKNIGSPLTGTIRIRADDGFNLPGDAVASFAVTDGDFVVASTNVLDTVFVTVDIAGAGLVLQGGTPYWISLEDDLQLGWSMGIGDDFIARLDETTGWWRFSQIDLAFQIRGVVPAPASIAPFGAGALLLGVRRRR